MNTRKINLFVILCLMLAGCNQIDDTITEDPYAGGREPLNIQLLADPPSPASGYPGDTVVFKAKGLSQKNASGEYGFEFFLSDEKVRILAADENSVTIKVPENVSTGISHLLMQGQVFFGPKFTVLGNIRIDKEYGLSGGVTGSVLCYLPHRDRGGDFYIGGSLYVRTASGSSYTSNRRGLAHVQKNGVLSAVSSAKYMASNPLTGGGQISSMSYFSDGRVLLSGSFTSYENLTSRKNGVAVNNMVVLNNNMSIRTKVDTLYYNNREYIIDVSLFNGGSEQVIVRSFVTSKDSVIAVGNITSWCGINWDYSSYMDYAINYLPAKQIMKMDDVGKLDTIFRKGLSGANDIITDAFIDSDDALYIAGEFTSFDGKPANRIVKLNAAGMIDNDFMANTGGGANGPIDVVRYNKQHGKIAVTGRFSSFNGHPRNGVALLNIDGTLDMTFALKDIAGGYVNYAQFLDLERVVISGTFTKYDGVTRSGFIIVEPDGTAIQGFNVPGAFAGQLHQALESETTTGFYGLLLMGDFSRFNGEKANNIVMVEVDFN
ncbi:MAG: DUF5008 domain-containing protein [Prevotellaceae bacterium]|jgi:hypothetical protein|nr:DUF5008 domain-containing protein [Prevotellaceae bacterium]